MGRFVTATCLILAAYLTIATGHTAAAQSGLPDHTLEAVLESLQYQRGRITLGNDLATLTVSDNFSYLNNADTQKFLTLVWQNPPGTGRTALGMLVPADVNLMAEDAWAIVIHYEDAGYVSDADAEKIDYDDLMHQMRKQVHDDSAQRIADGYEAFELLGWARRPYYDRDGNKMYWAKQLRFGDGPHETLNYEIRILGRHGVLELNMVAGMDMLSSVDAKVPAVLKMVEFNPGNTYAEFDPGMDKVAAYGLAGLVAGGLLTKAGFFKGLLVLLLASKKLVGAVLIAGLIALWAGARRIMARR